MHRNAARIPREIIRAKRGTNPRRSVDHRKFVAAIGICPAHEHERAGSA